MKCPRIRTLVSLSLDNRKLFKPPEIAGLRNKTMQKILPVSKNFHNKSFPIEDVFVSGDTDEYVRLILTVAEIDHVTFTK